LSVALYGVSRKTSVALSDEIVVFVSPLRTGRDLKKKWPARCVGHLCQIVMVCGQMLVQVEVI
jgi:hypothetical protein